MTDQAGRPDHNSLGKASFIIGLIGLVLSFVPFIGMIAWLLAPLAVLFGLIALRRAPRSLAIAGIVTGLLGLMMCFMWIKAAKGVGEAMGADTFNNSGVAADTTTAPIIDATIKGIGRDLAANKIAAGKKYGGKRLRFTNERIDKFSGDASNPSLQFDGVEQGYLIQLVDADFAAGDGGKLAAMKKGQKVSFVCTTIKENIGDGYSLNGCQIQ